MDKLKKSNTTREMEESSKAGQIRLDNTFSKHFEPGEKVIHLNRTALILNRLDNKILVKWDDDGTTEVIHPIALNRSK